MSVIAHQHVVDPPAGGPGDQADDAADDDTRRDNAAGRDELVRSPIQHAAEDVLADLVGAEQETAVARRQEREPGGLDGIVRRHHGREDGDRMSRAKAPMAPRSTGGPPAGGPQRRGRRGPRPRGRLMYGSATAIRRCVPGRVAARPAARRPAAGATGSRPPRRAGISPMTMDWVRPAAVGQRVRAARVEGAAGRRVAWGWPVRPAIRTPVRPSPGTADEQGPGVGMRRAAGRARRRGPSPRSGPGTSPRCGRRPSGPRPGRG